MVFTDAAVGLALEFKRIAEFFDFPNRYTKLALQHSVDLLGLKDLN
jgi:hypothetical protein